MTLRFVYVADCAACGIRQGFGSREERAQWSVEHKTDTGHVVDIEVEVWR